MDEEGLVVKSKNDERVHIARLLKICKISNPNIEESKGAPIQKKWTLLTSETLNMDTTESNEAVSMLADVGREI